MFELNVGDLDPEQLYGRVSYTCRRQSVESTRSPAFSNFEKRRLSAYAASVTNEQLWTSDRLLQVSDEYLSRA